jgi:hypothetical protein
MASRCSVVGCSVAILMYLRMRLSLRFEVFLMNNFDLQGVCLDED